MATYKMCSVLDMVAQQHGRPFFAVSEGSAVRGFSDEINQREQPSTLSQHPNDFQLFLLGEFDDSSGAITLLPTPQLLVSGSQLVKRPGAVSAANGFGNPVGTVHPDEDSRNG